MSALVRAFFAVLGVMAWFKAPRKTCNKGFPRPFCLFLVYALHGRWWFYTDSANALKTNICTTLHPVLSVVRTTKTVPFLTLVTEYVVRMMFKAPPKFREHNLLQSISTVFGICAPWAFVWFYCSANAHCNYMYPPVSRHLSRSYANDSASPHSLRRVRGENVV